MAEDQKKVKLDIGSVEEAGQKLGDGLAKGFKTGIDEAAEDLSSGKLKKKLASTFSFDGLKKNLSENINKGLEVRNNKESKLRTLLKQNTELSAGFAKTITNGASAGKVMSSGLALAKNHIAGMAANMNPYVAALKVGVALVKEFLKNYQKTLEASTKFISQGSLFADKQTMSMMQRTGQSASGAQGTQRALDRLGLDFNDLQTGQMTQAQMKMFEQIRKEETARLESIQKVGGPVFEAMQHAAVAVAGAKQKVSDTITMMFASSKGVMQFAAGLRTTATAIGDIIWSAGKFLAPVVNVIGTVVGSVMQVVGIVADVLSMATSALAPIGETVNQIINVISDYLGNMLSTIGRLVSSTLKPIFSAISKVVKNILAPIQVAVTIIGEIVNVVFKVLEPFLIIFETVFGLMEAMMPIMDVMKLLQPVLDFVVMLINKLADAILWVVKIILQSIKWVIDSVIGAIGNAIEWIAGAFHEMVRGLIKTVTLGINDIGAYQGIGVTSAINNISGGVGSAIAAIENNTTYNYGTGQTNAPEQSVSNQNLFNNMYTIVND